MILERLYKTSSKGAIQVIDITISGAVYTRIWGQLDGKVQSKETTATPKNEGRSNATTAEEQAVLEAKAVWIKKQKAGYSLSPEAPTTVKLPMKVNDYHKHKKKVSFPCYTSPKLNGVNVEYRLISNPGDVDVLKLLSRGGEEYPVPVHQETQVLMLLQALGTNSINGEMYCHGEHLQDIMAATKKHNELTPRLKFNVFDFPEVGGTYQERCAKMYSIKDSYKDFDTSDFPFVPVWVANSHEEIDDQYKQCVDAGYEGLVIRNAKAEYKYNTRSNGVFKYKTMKDAEYEVIGFKIDKNKHAVYTCVTPLGDMFSVKRRGTSEERLKDAEEAPSNVGKFLRVEYEMLSKDKKPLKPIGDVFRKVGENGEAME